MKPSRFSFKYRHLGVEVDFRFLSRRGRGVYSCAFCMMVNINKQMWCNSEYSGVENYLQIIFGIRH